jgi:hypothetical protein
MFETSATRQIGAKSFRLSYGMFGYSVAFTASGPTDPMSSV